MKNLANALEEKPRSKTPHRRAPFGTGQARPDAWEADRMASQFLSSDWPISLCLSQSPSDHAPTRSHPLQGCGILVYLCLVMLLVIGLLFRGSSENLTGTPRNKTFECHTLRVPHRLIR